MENLIEALEIILSWLQKNASSSASSLQHGLTFSEIENRVEVLPVFLPTEFYKLYQWHNGVFSDEEDFTFFCPAYSFNSLEKSFIQYEKLLEEAQKIAEDLWLDPSEIWNKSWFPIFSYDKDYLFIVGEEKKRYQSPVMSYFRGNPGPNLWYPSITKMMLAIGECYETGVYYIDGNNEVTINYVEEELVRQKYLEE